MDSTRLRYFAASNSEDGFHSFYREVFDRKLTHIYIIKGGPGTGKSRLMRHLAGCAERAGYRVEEIYCSSDPTSLDGVIAYDPKGNNHFALLDGTAPHVTEMELPGARDELLYVGDFWSAEQLATRRPLLEKLAATRSAAYRRLYHFLKAMGQCRRSMTALFEGALNEAKMQSAVSHILDRYPVGRGYHQRIMVNASLGMNGAFRFDPFVSRAGTVFQIKDHGATAHLLFEEILRQAKRHRLPVWLSYDPLIPTRIDGIFLPDQHIAFVPYDKEAVLPERAVVRRLSMRRYLDADAVKVTKADLAIAAKCEERLMEAALEVLRQIKETHFEMESHYQAAMDFDAMEKQIERWTQKIIPK